MNTSDSRDGLPANAYWVVPGLLAAGEYPGAFHRQEAAAKLRVLLRAGFDHFIDLTEEGELQPYAQIAEREAAALGMEVAHERHPIVDVSVPRSPRQTSAILDAVDAALANGKRIYVHCWGGVGRTGTVIGCWLVRRGDTGEEALGKIARWWRGMEKARRHPRSPETPRQRRYVRDWTEPAR